MSDEVVIPVIKKSPQQPLHMGSRIAAWWDQQAEETEQILTRYVQAHPGTGRVIVAGSVQTAIDLGHGFVDVLRVGEGVRQGTAGGYAKDALRAVSIVLPALRMVRAFTSFFRAGTAEVLSADAVIAHHRAMMAASGSIPRGTLVLHGHGAAGKIEMAASNGALTVMLKVVKELAPIIRSANPQRVILASCEVARNPASVQQLANLVQRPITAYTQLISPNTKGVIMSLIRSAASASGYVSNGPAKAVVFNPSFVSGLTAFTHHLGTTVLGLSGGALATIPPETPPRIDGNRSSPLP